MPALQEITMSYLAVLIAPDGEYVTDFPSETVKEVWDRVNDMGSRWIFYPLPVVARDDKAMTVVSYPDGVIGPSLALNELLTDVRNGELDFVFSCTDCGCQR